MSKKYIFKISSTLKNYIDSRVIVDILTLKDGIWSTTVNSGGNVERIANKESILREYSVEIDSKRYEYENIRNSEKIKVIVKDLSNNIICESEEINTPSNIKKESISFDLSWIGLPKEKKNYINNYLRYIKLGLDFENSDESLKDKLGTVRSIKYVKDDSTILYTADTNVVNTLNNTLQNKTGNRYNDIEIIPKTKLSNITESESVKVKAVIESSTGTYESNFITKENVLDVIRPIYLIDLTWDKTNDKKLSYNKDENIKTFKVNARVSITNSSNLDIGRVALIPNYYNNNIIVGSSGVGIIGDSLSFDVDSSVKSFNKTVSFNVTIPDDKYNKDGIDDLFCVLFLDEYKENYSGGLSGSKEGFLNTSSPIEAKPNKNNFEFSLSKGRFLVEGFKSYFNDNNKSNFNFTYEPSVSSNDDSVDLIKNVTVKLINLNEDGNINEIANKTFDSFTSKGFKKGTSYDSTLNFNNVTVPNGNNKVFLTITGKNRKNDGNYFNEIDTVSVSSVCIDSKPPKIGWYNHAEGKEFDKKTVYKDWFLYRGSYTYSGNSSTDMQPSLYYNSNLNNFKPNFSTLYSVYRNVYNTPMYKMNDDSVSKPTWDKVKIDDFQIKYISNFVDNIETGTHTIKALFKYDNKVEEVESENNIVYEMIEGDKHVEISYDDNSVIFETFCNEGFNETPSRTVGFINYYRLKCNDFSKNILVKGLSGLTGNKKIFISNDVNEYREQKMNVNNITIISDGVIENINNLELFNNNFVNDVIGSRMKCEQSFYAFIELEDYNVVIRTNNIKFNIYKNKN